MQLVPFPDLGFRLRLLAILASDVLGSFLWDRLMVFCFARGIFEASWQDWAGPSSAYKPILTTMGSVVGAAILASLVDWDWLNIL